VPGSVDSLTLLRDTRSCRHRRWQPSRRAPRPARAVAPPENDFRHGGFAAIAARAATAPAHAGLAQAAASRAWHASCSSPQPMGSRAAAVRHGGESEHLERGESAMETVLREAKEQKSEVPATVKEQIVLEHAPLIRYIVNRIAVRLPSHIDLDDLHNTGVIGLMDAIEKYDPEKNCKFKTYAEFRIKGAILDQLRSLDWVPRSVRQKGRRLERAYGEVEQRLGRSASEEEVADSLGLQIDKFHELLNADGERTGSYADIVEDVHSENPFSALKQQETRRVIAETISSLPEKERLVLSLYYYEDLNMKEIGSILGITESRVCQIHTKAVGRLRSKLKSLMER
jgi:RNA polymerase sigma factor for flagellar operon FliA